MNKWAVYWHKSANSGIWYFENRNSALIAANDLAGQQEVYDVVLLHISNVKVIKRSGGILK